jgi:hypothetical protein
MVKCRLLRLRRRRSPTPSRKRAALGPRRAAHCRQRVLSGALLRRSSAHAGPPTLSRHRRCIGSAQWALKSSRLWYMEMAGGLRIVRLLPGVARRVSSSLLSMLIALRSSTRSRCGCSGLRRKCVSSSLRRRIALGSGVRQWSCPGKASVSLSQAGSSSSSSSSKHNNSISNSNSRKSKHWLSRSRRVDHQSRSARRVQVCPQYRRPRRPTRHRSVRDTVCPEATSPCHYAS